MSYIRFNHVFFGLMGLSALSAFVIPPRYTYRVEPQLQGIFSPVARPVAAIASWAHDRVAPETLHDRRKATDIQRENVALRTENAQLAAAVNELRRQQGITKKMGNISDLCTLVSVVGPDSGPRQSLSLSGSTFEGLRNDMWVVYEGGIVGQIERAGIGGAQVKLITDPSCRIQATFTQFKGNDAGEKPRFVPLGLKPAVVEGAGKGTMIVRSMLMRDIEANGLKEGDWLIVNDNDCPSSLQGRPLGHVLSISPRRDLRSFAQIVIVPNENLSRLREVMVLTKDKLTNPRAND